MLELLAHAMMVIMLQYKEESNQQVGQLKYTVLYISKKRTPSKLSEDKITIAKQSVQYQKLY